VTTRLLHQGPAEALAELARDTVRIAIDLVTNDALKHDPVYYADREKLEPALGDQEPFWKPARSGSWWQEDRKSVV